MNRVVIALVALTLLAGAAGAQEEPNWIGTHYQPGALILTLPVSLSAGGGIGFGTVPSVEFVFSKIRPLGIVSLDLTAGARAAGSIWTSLPPDYGAITLGGVGSLGFHVGLRGLPGSASDLTDRLDFYSAFGLGYLLANPTGNWGSLVEPSSGLVWGNFSGVNFFISDSLAINAGSNWFTSLGGGFVPGSGSGFSGSIGITIKTGPAEEISGVPTVGIPDVSALSGNVMYIAFLTYYAVAGAFSGYAYDDPSFAPGDGVVFGQRYTDPETLETAAVTFTRILLDRFADGGSKWRFDFAVEDENPLELLFEVELAPDGQILLLRYRDPDTGEILEFEPDSATDPLADAEYATYEDAGSAFVRTERVVVPAGTFTADLYSGTDGEVTFRWWISDAVPGRIVKSEFVPTDGDEDVRTADGELLEIITGYRSPW